MASLLSADKNEESEVRITLRFQKKLKVATVVIMADLISLNKKRHFFRLQKNKGEQSL